MEFTKFDEKAFVIYLGVVISTLTICSYYYTPKSSEPNTSIPNSVSFTSILAAEDPEVTLLKAKISGLERKVAYLTNFAHRLKTSFTVLLNVEEEIPDKSPIEEVLSPYQLSIKASTLEKRVSELMILLMDKIRLIDDLYQIIEDLETYQEDSKVLEEEISNLESTIEQNNIDYSNLEMENEILLEENHNLKHQIAELQRIVHQNSFRDNPQPDPFNLNSEYQNHVNSNNVEINFVKSESLSNPMIVDKTKRRPPPARRSEKPQLVDNPEDLHQEVEDLINELNL